MKLDLKKLKVGESISPAEKEKKGSGEKKVYPIASEEALRELLKKYRKKNKVTQEEIAIFSNLSRLAVNEFESGKTDIRLSTFFKMLKAYGLELELKE